MPAEAGPPPPEAGSLDAMPPEVCHSNETDLPDATPPEAGDFAADSGVAQEAGNVAAPPEDDDAIAPSGGG